MVEVEGIHPDAPSAGGSFDESYSFEDGTPEGWALTQSERKYLQGKAEDFGYYEAPDGECVIGTIGNNSSMPAALAYTSGFELAAGEVFTIDFKYLAPGYNLGQTLPAKRNYTTTVNICSDQEGTVVATLGSIVGPTALAWQDEHFEFTPEADGTYYVQFSTVANFFQDCGFALIDLVEVSGVHPASVPAPDPISEYPALESFEDELVGWTLPACDRPFAVFNYQDCGLTTVPDGENILFVSETRNTYDAAPVAVTNGYVMTAGTSYRVTFYYRAPGAGNAVQVVNTSVSVGTAADACDLVIGTVNGVVADWTKQTFKFTPTEDGTYYFQIKSEPQTANSGNVAIDAFAVEVLPASVSTYPAEEGFEGALAGWYLAPADRPFAVFAGTDCGTQAPEGDNILFTSEVSSAFTAPVAVSNGFVMEAGQTYRVSFAYYAPAGAQDARVATTTLKVGSEWDACDQLLGTITGKVAAWTTYTYFFTPEAAGTYYFQLATTAELTSCGGVGIDAFTVEAAPAVVTEFPAEESFEDGLAGWTLGLADRRFAISNAEDSGLASVADGEYALIVPETGNTYDVAPKATTNGYALRAGQAYTVEFRYLAAGGTPATVRFVKTTVKAGTDINNCTELLGEINAAVADWTKEVFVFTPATDGVYYFEIEAAAQSTACGLVGLDLFKVKEFNPITEIPAVESFEDELVDWTFSEGERYFAVYSSEDAGVEAYDGDYVLILPETSPAFGAPYVVTNGYALNAGQKYEVSFKYLAPGNDVRKNTITVKVGTDAEACTTEVLSIKETAAEWAKAKFTFAPEADGYYFFQIQATANLASAGLVALDEFVVGNYIEPISEFPAEESFEDELVGWTLSEGDRYFAVYSSEDAGVEAFDGDNVLIVPETAPAFGEPYAVTNGYTMTAGQKYEVSFKYLAPGNDVRKNTLTVSYGTDNEFCNTEVLTIEETAAEWAKAKFVFTPEADGVYYFQVKAAANLPSAGLVALDDFIVAEYIEPISEYPAEESFEDEELVGWTLSEGDRFFAVYSSQDAGVEAYDGDNLLILPETSPAFGTPTAVTNGYVMTAGQKYEVSFKYLAPGGAAPRKNTLTVSYGTDNEFCNTEILTIEEPAAEWAKAKFVFTPEADGVYYFQVKATANLTSAGLVALDDFLVAEYVEPISEYPAEESFEDELVGWTIAETERQFAVYSSADAGVEAYDGDYVLIVPETSSAFAAPTAVTNGYVMTAGQQYDLSFKYLAPGNGVRKNTLTVSVGTDNEFCDTELLTIEETAAEWTKVKFTYTPEADGIYFFEVKAAANLPSAGLVALDDFRVAEYIAPISEYPAEESFEDELVGWTLSEGERYFAVYSSADAGVEAFDGDNVLIVPETAPAFGEPTAVTNGYVMAAGQKYEVSFKYLAPGNDVRKNTLTVSYGIDNEFCNTELLTVEEAAAEWAKVKFTFTPEADGVYYFQVKAAANLPSAGLVALDDFRVAEYVATISEYPAAESFEEELEGWTIGEAERYFVVASSEDAGVAAADGDYLLIVPETSSNFSAPTAVTNGYEMVAGQAYEFSFKYLAPGNGVRKNTLTVNVGTDNEFCNTEVAKVEEVAEDWTKVKFVFTPDADGVYYFEFQAVANLTSAGLVAIDDINVIEFNPTSEYPAVESFEEELVGWTIAETERQFAVYSSEDAGVEAADGNYVLIVPETSSAFAAPTAVTNGYVMTAGQQYDLSFKYLAPGNGIRKNTTTVKVGTDSEACDTELVKIEEAAADWTKVKFSFTPEADGVYYFEIQSVANLTSASLVAIDAFTVAEHVEPISEYPAVESFEEELVGWTIAATERQFAVYSSEDAGVPAADGDYVLIVPETSSEFGAPTAVTNGYVMVAGQQYDVTFKYLAPGNGIRKNTTTVKVGTDVEECDTELVKIEDVATEWTKVKFSFTPEEDGIYYFEIQSVANLTSAALVAIDAFTVAEYVEPISEYPAVESFEEDLRGWSFSNTERYFMVASAEDAGLQGAPDGDNVLVLPETSPAFGEPTAVTNGYVMEAGEIYEITFQYYAPGNNAPSVRYNTTTLSVGTDRDECNLTLGNLTGVFDQWEEEAFWFSPEEDGVYYFEIKSVANVPACGMVAIDLFSVDKLVEETVYLAGQCNGWNPAAEGYKFARQDDGTYTLDVEGSVGEFKLTNGTWDVNYGSNGEALVAGEPYQLAQKGGNLTVNVTNPHFVLDVATWTLTVTGDVAEMEVPEALYLVGNIDGHNWDIANAVPFTREEGTNTFKLTKAPIVAAGDDTNYGYFSFITTCGSSWDEVNASDRFGATTPDAEVVAPATADVEWFQGGVNAGSACAWKIAAGNYDITVDFDAMTVQIIASEEGAIDIEVINSDARYFNLQGVEVPAPSNGVFIEVLGTQVRKVYVK